MTTPSVLSSAPPVRGASRTVALTFDDGPGRSTQAILDILESFHVRATFFNVGQEEVYRPQLVQEEANDGFLLGNHTVDHPFMPGLSASAQAAELDGVSRETQQLTGTLPCVFRPPYGSYDATTVALATARRLAVWTWNVSTDDWEARGSGSAAWIHHIVWVAETEGLATDHAVVLFHNQPIAMPATVAALPVVIRFFLAHGYRFVDLLGRTGWPGTCAPGGSPAPPIPGTPLLAGHSLAAGRQLASPGGQFDLVLQPGGDLVLRLATGRVLFRTHTGGHRGAHLQVERDGDVVLESASGAVLWTTSTSGHPGARLVVGADGDLDVLAGTTQVWSSHTRISQLLPGERLLPRWRLTSPDGRCRLVQQAGGPLQLLDGSGQVLFSPGSARAGAITVLEADGNLVQLVPGSSPTWMSQTRPAAGDRAVLLSRGALALRTPDGTPFWVTP